MMLGNDYIPIRKIGQLSPLAIVDNSAYEFYRLAPPRVMMVSISVGLGEFTAEDVERAFEPLDALTLQLVERQVDIIIQGGVPLPILIGQEALRRILDRIEEVGGVPATSTVLSVVEAARGIGLKKIAVANKWTDQMNHCLGEFFNTGGVQVIGTSARSMAPSEFQKMSSDEGVNLAYQLGRAALEAHPESDGLYIGGGAWLTLPATLRLEEEFGKPVITNQNSTLWDVCRKLNCWQPRSDAGRLMALA